MHRAFHALRLLVLTATLVSLKPTFAVQSGEVLSNPALEESARNLSQQMPCMVGQKQSWSPNMGNPKCLPIQAPAQLPQAQ